MSGFLCTVEPLTCPRHEAPEQRCPPVLMPLTEQEVIARQVPSFGQAYVSLGEAVFVPVHTDPERLVVDSCTLNESLLLDVLTFLDLNRHRWTQHAYLGHDGDGLLIGCLAGWAAVMNAAQPGDPDFAIAARLGTEIHRAGKEALGLSEAQAGALFGYTYTVENNSTRHPTFAELCAKVREVTGVNYQPKEMAA